jgi:hypothetical protein
MVFERCLRALTDTNILPWLSRGLIGFAHVTAEDYDALEQQMDRVTTFDQAAESPR